MTDALLSQDTCCLKMLSVDSTGHKSISTGVYHYPGPCLCPAATLPVGSASQKIRDKPVVQTSGTQLLLLYAVPAGSFSQSLLCTIPRDVVAWVISLEAGWGSPERGIVNEPWAGHVASAGRKLSFKEPPV